MAKDKKRIRIEAIQRKWAYKRIRIYLKEKCIDIDTSQLSNLNYCIDKYYQTIGQRRPQVKSGRLLLKEYNNPKSPIFNGVKLKTGAFEEVAFKQRKMNYKRYLNSAKWIDPYLFP